MNLIIYQMENKILFSLIAEDLHTHFFFFAYDNWKKVSTETIHLESDQIQHWSIRVIKASETGASSILSTPYNHFYSFYYSAILQYFYITVTLQYILL